MSMVGRILALAGFLLCAATSPPPPPELASYIHDDGFEAGDYAWARGAFADATTKQREEFRAANEWSARCSAVARERLIAELKAEGIDNAVLPDGTFARECQVMLPPFDTRRTFAEFESALQEARPIADTYVAAARLAGERALYNALSEGETLAARTLEEQMLRFAFNWGRAPLAEVPELSPDGLAMLRGLIAEATARSDHDNTEWLKARVATSGWPLNSEVGERGARGAWLLVQHADADPLFQIRALRLMEPLVTRGEASKQNYAYLYDRVMLKLTGKQRYGTQWGACDGAVRPLRPLENEDQLSELRAEMELIPLDEYADHMDRMYGPCAEG